MTAAAASHGGSGPALDFPVQIRTAPHVDAEAAAVVLARVPADSHRTVLLERRLPELRRCCPHLGQPEPLGGLDVSAMVNVDPENEPVAFDPRDVKEPEEEADQCRIAVDESDSVVAAVRLVLGALAPVRDGPGDQDLPLLSKPACAIAASLMASRLAARAGRSASQYRRTASA